MLHENQSNNGVSKIFCLGTRVQRWSSTDRIIICMAQAYFLRSTAVKPRPGVVGPNIDRCIILTIFASFMKHAARQNFVVFIAVVVVVIVVVLGVQALPNFPLVAS